jgi:hypothetical protein
MDYTPRQIAAFVVIAADRRRRELAEQLQIHALAAQGQGKAITGALKDLSDGR